MAPTNLQSADLVANRIICITTHHDPISSKFFGFLSSIATASLPSRSRCEPKPGSPRRTGRCGLACNSRMRPGCDARAGEGMQRRRKAVDGRGVAARRSAAAPVAVIAAAFPVVMAAFCVLNPPPRAEACVATHSAMASNLIAGASTPIGRADAIPAPTLAIRHSPCGMCSGFNLKRDSSLVVVQCDCQWLKRIGYRWSPA